MKRLLRVFELTVPEQRVVIVLLSLLVLFVAVKHHRRAADPAPSPNDLSAQPSPSPGMRP